MYNLYIKQKVFKITDHYEVLDENNKAIYYVDQDFRLIGNRVHVHRYDNSKDFTIDRRVVTLMPRYDITFSDGKSFEIKQNFTIFNKEIELLSSDYNLKLVGNFWDLDFEVYDYGKKIGEIHKEWISWGDTYTIRVIDPYYEEELVALLIALDEIKDYEKKTNNGSQTQY